MNAIFRISILPESTGIGSPQAWCSDRGDLGSLTSHAKATGYRAKELAAHIAVPSRELRRRFKDAFGISLKNWLVQVRCEEVRTRLLGNESVEAIAYSVGFSHAKELSREFRKINGVTPSAYRVALLQKPEARSQKPEARSQKPEARSQNEALELTIVWLLRLVTGRCGDILPRIRFQD